MAVWCGEWELGDGMDGVLWKSHRPCSWISSHGILMGQASRRLQERVGGAVQGLRRLADFPAQREALLRLREGFDFLQDCVPKVI
jgi:hypothetical protein